MTGGYKLIDGGGLNLSTTSKQTSTLYAKLLEVVEQDKFILLENLVIGSAPVKPIPVTGWKSNTAEITLVGGGYTFVCDASGVTISASGGGGGGGGGTEYPTVDLTGVDIGVATVSNKVNKEDIWYTLSDYVIGDAPSPFIIKGIKYSGGLPMIPFFASGYRDNDSECFYIYIDATYILVVDSNDDCWFITAS